MKFKPVYFWGSYLLKIVPGFVILLFILQLTTRISIGNKVSLFLGGISYEIYLIHGPVFDVLKKYLPIMDSGVFIFMAICATVLASALIHMIGRPLINTMSKIFNVQ